MEGLNLSAFFVGAATMYFTMWAAIMLSKRHRSRFLSVLGWIFVVWAVFNLKDIIITYPDYYTEEVQNYILFIDGWSAITYTIFIFELTTPGWTTWRKLFMLSIPWFIFYVVYAIDHSETVLYAYVLFLWFYAWTVIGISYVRVRKYLRYIRNNYSNIDEIDISWIKIVFWFCIFSQLAWLGNSLLYNAYSDAMYYITTIAMWQIIIYYSSKFRPIVIEETTQEDIYLAKREYPFADYLDKTVEEQQLYLNQELTLDDLAKTFKTNRTYLSNYFNSIKGQPFYYYINQLRIERKAIPMIHEHPEYTLEYIAAESGFKSISTFRRAFHKLKGMSPGQYREKLEFDT